MSESILLSTLADGAFHSGEDLASVMGVSRTAVWKQMKRLTQESGLEVESVRGKGYRIPSGLDLLCIETITANLPPEARDLMQELLILPRIDSTNAELLRRAETGVRSGVVCTAEQQTAGRGRRGRQWVSPFAANLYVSALWEFQQGAAALEGLSLAVGVAVARALEGCGVPGATLKWPNDVLYAGAKLGGVLIEMTGDAAGPCQVVVGVGLNVAMPSTAGAQIDQSWTDVRRICGEPRPSRNRLLAALLSELLPLLAQFETRGFAPWHEVWQSLDAFAGRAVVLNTGEREFAGTAQGVDHHGALQLATTSGVRSIYGGEISLRATS